MDAKCENCGKVVKDMVNMSVVGVTEERSELWCKECQDKLYGGVKDDAKTP